MSESVNIITRSRSGIRVNFMTAVRAILYNCAVTAFRAVYYCFVPESRAQARLSGYNSYVCSF